MERTTFYYAALHLNRIAGFCFRSDRGHPRQSFLEALDCLKASEGEKANITHMKQLMALFAVLLSVPGILKAENEDENGAPMTYTHPIALYDDNLLSFYYSTARIHIDAGSSTG